MDPKQAQEIIKNYRKALPEIESEKERKHIEELDREIAMIRRILADPDKLHDFVWGNWFRYHFDNKSRADAEYITKYFRSGFDNVVLDDNGAKFVLRILLE